MDLSLITDAVNAAGLALSVWALVLLLKSGALSVYWPMLVISTWQVVPTVVFILGHNTRVFSIRSAYIVFFYTYWVSYGLAALASLFLTYTIFAEALRPLKGLRRLGSIMYQWTAIVSVALALSVFFSTDTTTNRGIVTAIMLLQRSSAVMVLSLITFVGLSIRPLGLSARSRVFGLSAGLAFMTLFTLLESASLFKQGRLSSYQSLIDNLANCATLSVWVWYFSVPEPKRRFILLPTTSPFHTWNQISELLGHDPGFVAIAGVPPESFAPAEIDIFGKASKNMAKIEAGEMPPDRPAAYYINMEADKPADRYRPVEDWNLSPAEAQTMLGKGSKPDDKG